jgi:type IX secretion system substrate protein
VKNRKPNNKINGSKTLLLILFLIKSTGGFSQEFNHSWLLGYTTNPAIDKARMDFTNNSYSILLQQRKIPFWETQGNISDVNGSLLISSNGYFIANATGDTMINGSGINPGQFTEDYKTYGLPLPYGNIILPMPDDSTKYVLFHQTANYSSPTFASTEIYYSIIDINLTGGLGAVISKNNIIINGSFGWGMTACKHGNGRDWWIVALSDSGTTAYKILLTPDTIQYMGSEYLQVPAFVAWGGQPTFSPDGEQFAFSHTKFLGTGQYPLDIRLFYFDRCTGIFTNKMYLTLGDSTGGFGIGFSSNSRFLYVSSTQRIYQFDTDSSNIPASKLTVSINDTFLSAPPVFYTNFHLMYHAANGKIYISSTSSVLHLHEINYPDSAGLNCNVQLHNIYTDCFFIGVPNHPNYYLGAKTGSPCDTLGLSVAEINHNFHLKIFPNPVTDGNFKITYLLPQNKGGRLEIFDVTGKRIYMEVLPPWSTLQYIIIPKLADGVYNCVITSSGERVSKKLLVFNE